MPSIMPRSTHTALPTPNQDPRHIQAGARETPLKRDENIPTPQPCIPPPPANHGGRHHWRHWATFQKIPSYAPDFGTLTPVASCTICFIALFSLTVRGNKFWGFLVRVQKRWNFQRKWGQTSLKWNYAREIKRS